METNFILITRPESLEVTITCEINAPVDLVFETFSNPDLIPQWWGPGNLTTRVVKHENKPGGIWRYVQKEPDGKEYAFHGIFHEINPPHRIVQTFEFEGVPGHVFLETIIFEEIGDTTRITDQSVFQSVADRDEMINSGMEHGSRESMSRLADLIDSLKEK